MSDARQCLDCHRVRPVEAFYKTQGGAGRSARCRDCIETRATEHRVEKAAARKQESEELLDFLSSGGLITELSPDQWLAEGRLKRGGPNWMPKARPRSNSPRMGRCWGCGEEIPLTDFYRYHIVKGQLRFRNGEERSHYCKPCVKRRAVERECADCGTTVLTTTLRTESHLSPHCVDCREKRTRAKHCPRCQITKPLHAFGSTNGRPTGWCKICIAASNRERRRTLREAMKRGCSGPTG